MNTKAKGRRTEKKCIELLRSQGYLAESVERGGRFRKDKDLWDYWDVITIKEQLNGAVIRLIQVKTNKSGQKWKAPLKKFAWKYRSPKISYEIWNWIDRKGFTIEVL